MEKELLNEVILVDQNDQEVGLMEKLEAHKKGLLHRAFSVLVFNDRNELLLQRRAFGKYHSEGLWTNTCCSHPAPGESVLEAAHRRLQEEMGFDCELCEGFSFIYRAELDNNLVEHELDHVVIGFSDETPHLNTNEAIAFRWMSLNQTREEIRKYPEHYTYWFKLIIEQYFDQLSSYLKHESLQKGNI